MRGSLSGHIPLLAWTLFVVATLLAPSDGVSVLPEWLSPLAAQGVDKLVHWALFFVEAAVISRSLRALAPEASLTSASRWMAATLAAALGLALESAQPALADRTFEWADAVANAFGAGCWWALARLRGGR